VNPTAKQALELRGQLSKSSVSKLDAIVARTAQDGRLRNSYQYHKAHTGRWAGEGVQLQNLVRGNIEDVAGATEAIRQGLPIDKFGKPMDVVASCIRSAFRAPSGYHFTVADLGQIEPCVLVWLSGCKALAKLLREADPYISFASAHLYKKPTSEITKHERQVSKSAVLGAGFGISGGEEKEDKNGDIYKSGLWGYAANMGVEMTQAEAIAAVAAFRAAYEEITSYWKSIQNAIVRAVVYGETVEFGYITIGAVPSKLLWIELPSGRRLHYVRARVDKDSRPDWPQVIYEGMGQKGWGVKRIWGGLATENVVQAIARDVLAEGMLRTAAAGFDIVLHTHDEIGCLVADGSRHNLSQLTDCMISPIDWAPGLLLKADGYEAVTYKK
jgi:DNA polymerase